MTQKSLRDEEMTSLTGVMKRINIISDLRARVKKACDCGFLHWHRVGQLSQPANKQSLGDGGGKKGRVRLTLAPSFFPPSPRMLQLSEVSK